MFRNNAFLPSTLFLRHSPSDVRKEYKFSLTGWNWKAPAIFVEFRKTSSSENSAKMQIENILYSFTA